MSHFGVLKALLRPLQVIGHPLFTGPMLLGRFRNLCTLRCDRGRLPLLIHQWSLSWSSFWVSGGDSASQADPSQCNAPVPLLLPFPGGRVGGSLMAGHVLVALLVVGLGCHGMGQLLGYLASDVAAA